MKNLMIALALPAAVALAGAGILVMAVTGVFNGAAPGEASFVQGQIDGDRYDITSKFTARVRVENVREGQAVSEGDTILTLSGDEMLQKVSQAREGVEQARAALLKLENGTREEQVRQLEASLKSAQSALLRAEGSYRRVASLYKSGVASKDSYDEAVRVLGQSREAAAAARAALDEGRNGARFEDLDAARANLKSLEAQYREVLSISKDLALSSPVSGEVDKIIVKRGELAAAGYPLATVISLGDLWSSVMLREDQLRAVRMGSVIRGSVPALSGQLHDFRIYYISPEGSYATWRAANNSGSYDLKTFEVRARPEKPIEGLRPGMSVVFPYPFQMR
ncbi:MAG: HlyD family secretion protein [Succinivibrio sp.]